MVGVDAAQVIPGLPRPLVKICDFGYSKHDDRSVPRSKVVSLERSAAMTQTLSHYRDFGRDLV